VAKQENPERAFDSLVAEIGESGFIPDAVFAEGSASDPQTINEFLGQFVGSSKRPPPEVRETIGAAYGERFGISLSESQVGTYAKAARRVRELKRGESSLRER
jgi:hypothetical protein